MAGRKAPHKKLFQNGALVQQLLREKGTLEKALTAGEEALQKAKATVAQIASKVAQEAQTLSTAAANFEASFSALHALGVSLSKEELLAGKEAASLETSQHFWREQSQRWNTYESAAQQLRIEKEKLPVAEKALLEVKQNAQTQTAEKERAFLKREETTQRLLTLKRANSNAVAELRQNLCAGEACLVCGSTDHPSAHIALPAIDGLVVQYEREVAEATHLFERVLRAEATAQSERKAGEKAVLQLQIEIQKLESPLAQLLTQWAHAATAEEHRQAAETRPSFYAVQQQQLEAQRKAYTLAQKSATDWRLAVVASENGAEKHRAAIAQIAEAETERTLRKTAVTENTLELKRYFTTPDWETKYSSNPTEFLTRVAHMSTEWQQKEDTLSRLQMTLQNAGETVAAAAQKCLAAEAEADEKKALSEEAKKRLEIAHSQRQTLLAGKAAAVVETQLAQKRNAAAIQLGVAEKVAEQLATGLRDLLKDRQQIRRQQAEMQQKETAALATVTEWLVAQKQHHSLQLSKANLAELLKTSPAQIATERAALAALKETAQQCKVRLQEREAQLQTVAQKLSAIPENQLHSAIALLADTIGDTSVQKAQVRLRLAKDDQGRAQLGDLLHRMEAQSHIAGRWQKLRELIGSSDGKAFRAIAQEYTLDILLLEANLQLAQLAPRYRLLRAAGTLDLQIIDGDMGNEVRTVHSISGGESFLVSLSLALGLAALSAGKQLVECLFIDEGFGMLDPATLHLALDALETLQQQGRKIGVISHIREMTDRIAVQIQVKKKSNGRSVVSVITDRF